MKRVLLICGILLLTGTTAITSLYFLSNRINHGDNGFIRLFPPHPVIRENLLDIKYNSYYIAGASNGKIFLGNVVAPLHLLSSNFALTDTQHVQLQIENFNDLKLKRLSVVIDTPFFYMFDGIRPAILRGDISDWTARKYMIDNAYFSEAIPISKSSFAIRAVSGATHENVLGKLTHHAKDITLNPKLLTKQIDGLFCTDGMLHYNNYLNELVYLYFYRNQYICIDTNLNIVLKGKTIDTVSRAQIKIASIEKDKSLTMGAPPLTVNKHSAVYKNYLLIHSNLLARNENKNAFDNSSVVDVYDLKNGIYQFSFYLNDVEHQKIKGFKFFNDTLIVLYETFLATYSVAPKYFK